MDVGFLYVSLGSSIVQLHDSLGSAGWALPAPFLYIYNSFQNKKVWVADAQAHDQRLVTVVKMATVLGCTTEEQHPFVRFCGQKDSMQGIFVKKCFLFTL
jgi:hypothetical protein